VFAWNRVTGVVSLNHHTQRSLEASRPQYFPAIRAGEQGHVGGAAVWKPTLEGAR